MTKRGEAATSQVYAWLKTEIESALDGAGEVDVAALAERAADDLLAKPEMSGALLREMVHRLAVSVSHTIITSTRVVSAGDTLLAPGALARKARTLRAKWATWIEHVDGRYLRLSAMTREQLLGAAGERSSRAERDGALAKLWVALADGLAEGEIVGAKYNDEQIDALWVRLSEPFPERVLVGTGG